MSHATACPEPAKLSALIDGVLNEDESVQVTDHLSGCTSCQTALEKAATGEIPVAQLVSAAEHSSPANESALWPVIGQVEKEFSDVYRTTYVGQDAATPAEDATPLTADLDFLEPPDDPAYLGKLDNFQIAGIIGRGGMGIVLDAFDTNLQRRVAIKVLNPKYQQNDVARQRFCREGRAAAAISHEHVVAMHHVAKAQEDKIAYLVMQMIEGDTLERRLAGGQPLPVSEVARIGMQVAAGLSAAHARDMVHRDVKPANILIEAETDRVKLTDFGLVRAGDDVKLTKTGMVTGTPLYMSPEQAMGSEADERADLFSLGAVMYEMATGASPFEAPTAVGVMKRIMDVDLEPPHERNPEVTRPLSDLIMALLAKQPEKRPESASQVAAALASIVSEFGPISPLQVPAVAADEVRKLSGDHCAAKRRWVMASWAAGAAGLVALLASVAFWFNSNDEGTVSETDLEPAFPSIVLPDNPGTVWSVDFSPSGNEIAAAIEDGSVRLWNIDDQKVIRSFNAHRGVVWMVQFHPSRPIVATAGDDGRVKLWDSENFEPLQEWVAPNAVRGVAFSPDGNLIAAGDREGGIHIYNIDTGDEVATKTQTGAIFNIDWSPDGQLLATVGSDKMVRLWDATSLDERQTMSGHDGPIYNVRFAQNGNLLATVGWNKNIRLWNVTTGIEEQKLVGSEGCIWGAAFCSDSTHLVTGGQDGAARVWKVEDGSIVTTLKGHSSAVHNISLDPARHRIATSSRDGTIRVWDLSSLRKPDGE